jgi:hypothetical protein
MYQIDTEFINMGKSNLGFGVWEVVEEYNPG